MSERTFDIVVFGATGFTGRLVAEYLAEHAGDVSWAVAGRSRSKLEALVAALPEGRRPGIVEADVEDPGSLARMASSARVVLNTVGPYLRWGEPVVQACVEAGTDHVDLTGEPAFVAGLLERWDEKAKERGVRLVPCCGFDSVPHDLGAMWTARQLPQDGPIEMTGIVRGSGTISGGTWASALEIIGRRGGPKLPRVSEPVRPVHGKGPALQRDSQSGSWLVKLPTIDPLIVLRSASVVEGYGTDFTYRHVASVKRTSTLAAGAVGLAGVVTLAQVKPGRKLLEKLRPSGSGPSPEQRAKGRFSVTFRARAGDVRLVTRVSGGDPGYGETSKMIAECALSLVQDRDRLPERAGVLTTAMAFEDRLVERLSARGIRFEVLER